jgi:hypothetical protein
MHASSDIYLVNDAILLLLSLSIYLSPSWSMAVDRQYLLRNGMCQP